MYWKDKICLITGGSAGLGLAIGRELAARQAKVILVARGQEQLDAAAAQLRTQGGNVLAIAGDMAWQEDVDRTASEVASQFGRLDMLVNCAGRSTRGAVLDTTPEDFLQLIEANFITTVRATRALAPMLLQSRGHVVNIGSLASKVAAPYLGAYPAAKHAVAAYAQQLRLELGPKGLHAILVCPGPIDRDDAGLRYSAGAQGIPDTAQAPGGGARLKRINPEQLAKKILKACESRRAELIVPRKARMLFAIAQLWPAWGDRLLLKSVSG
jgi:short-subunit dehydrogenase